MSRPVTLPTPKETGFYGQNEEAVEAAGAIGNAGGAGGAGGFPRSPSTAWISDELLIDTIEVWSGAYGRPVSEPEAVEILMNVKRLAEVLFEVKQEMNES